MTINEALQRFRQEQRLTRKAVADTLGIKAQSYIYEKKEVTPSAELILKLAKAFNVSADYLLGLTDDPRPVDEIITAQKTAAPAEVDDEILNAAIALVTALKRKTNSEEGSR